MGPAERRRSFGSWLWAAPRICPSVCPADGTTGRYSGVAWLELVECGVLFHPGSGSRFLWSVFRPALQWTAWCGPGLAVGEGYSRVPEGSTEARHVCGWGAGNECVGLSPVPHRAEALLGPRDMASGRGSHDCCRVLVTVIRGRERGPRSQTVRIELPSTHGLPGSRCCPLPHLKVRVPKSLRFVILK